MEITHFVALLPLLILLVLSLVFYGKGLVHLLTLSYAMALAFFAATNEWEIMFFPMLSVTVIITVILFFWSMSKGDWL